MVWQSVHSCMGNHQRSSLSHTQLVQFVGACRYFSYLPTLDHWRVNVDGSTFVPLGPHGRDVCVVVGHHSSPNASTKTQ